MKRGRGNRTSRAHQESRRAKAVDLMEKGLTQDEVIFHLGCSEATLVRDLAVLTERFKLESGPVYQELKKAQRAIYELMEKALLEGRIDPQTATAWRQIRDSVAELDGLNSPSRSVSISVDAGEKLVGYRRFCHETRFLSTEQLEQVFAFAATINVPPPMRVIGPPESCELWGDEQQQLLEGAE